MGSSLESTLLEADYNLTKHIIQMAIDNTHCPICQDHMFVPFMTKCGHNFCYGCLTTWLDSNTTCPGCRAEIEHPPYLNLNLQNTMKSLLETFNSLNVDLDNDSMIDLHQDMKAKVQKHKKDVEGDRLFGRIFKNSSVAVIDSSDGVARCGNCHWEVSGSRCLNCHVRLRNPYINEISSANTSDIEDPNYPAHFGYSDSENSSEDNEYVNDSFIDDSDEVPALGLHEIDSNSESESEQHSQTSSPVRQQPRYYPSILASTSWEDTLEDDSDLSGSLTHAPWSGFHSDIDAEVSDNQNLQHIQSEGESAHDQDTYDPMNTSNELDMLDEDQSDLEYDEMIKRVRNNISRRRIRGITLDSDEEE